MSNYNTKLQSNNLDLQAILNAINELPEAGVDLPELSNEGASADLLTGKQLIDSDGNVVTGSMPTTTQATPSITVDSSGLITASATQTTGYVTEGTKSATKQLTTQAAKTVTPTKSSQTVVSSGKYTTGNITVAAIPSNYITTTDANAVAGDILNTKTAYVNGSKVTGSMPNNGTISSTMDGISIKSVSIPSGYTSGGTVSMDGTLDTKINEEADLISQIKEKANSLPEAGSGGDTSMENALVEGTLTEYTNTRVSAIKSGIFTNTKLTSVNFPNVTTIGNSAFQNCENLISISFPNAIDIGNYTFQSCSKLILASFPKATKIRNGAFSDCSKLTSVSFPNITEIGDNAFYNCFSLTSVNFPNATDINSNAFERCFSLTSVNFPKVTYIGVGAFSNCSKLTSVSFPLITTINSSAFYGCSSLTTVSFPKAKTIEYFAFKNCYNLKSLYLTNSSLCTLRSSDAFSSTPIGGYSASAGTYGLIYVPASLLTAYQTATNWTYFSSRFVGI